MGIRKEKAQNTQMHYGNDKLGEMHLNCLANNCHNAKKKLK